MFGVKDGFVVAALTSGEQALRSNYGPLVRATLLVSAFGLCLGILGKLYPVFGVFVSWVVMPVVGTSFHYLGVRAYRSDLDGADFLEGFGRFFSLAAISLLQLLALAACMIPCFGALNIVYTTGSDIGLTDVVVVVIDIGLLLFVSARLSFAELVCLDTGVNVIESVRESWRITSRIWPQIVLLHILLGILLLVTMMLCLLPFFFIGMPLSAAIVGAAYCLAQDRRV